jgi:hypothetical protein
MKKLLAILTIGLACSANAVTGNNITLKGELNVGGGATPADSTFGAENGVYALGTNAKTYHKIQDAILAKCQPEEPCVLNVNIKKDSYWDGAIVKINSVSKQ